ncbi:partition protein (plasmid) [Borreliella chilensis]|uniref:Partition protein n=1 Tax=Borreliella chilensis TaxID=1245910 RepID=A0A0A7V399_9SPIR|nr:partition protein [Borreliella chilensis]
MKIKEKENKFFNRVEKQKNKIVYHTKIFSMINNFEAKPKKGKFWLCFRNVFNSKKYESFHLFSVKENDKFLGIFYGFVKLPKPFIINYSEKGIKKTIRLKKIFYVEFKFKKGSVFCYLRSLYILTKNKNKNKIFYKSLLERTLKIEDEIHKFYGKKYESNKGILNWIIKTQK